MRLVFYVFVFFFVSCFEINNKYKFQTDTERLFYTDSEGLDYFRFPLIMPYEVKCIDNEEWRVNLEVGTKHYLTIDQVEKVSGNDSIIFIYSGSTQIITIGKEPLRWFVLIPSKKEELGFSTEHDFKDYLKKNRIAVIKWIEVNKAYKQFRNDGCLPWVPGCMDMNN